MTESIQLDGFDRFKTDANLETGDGVTIEYDDGKSITVRRAGGRNTAYALALSDARAKMTGKKLSAEEDRRVMVGVVADTIVVGWSGITSGGKELEFTKANVVAVFMAYPELYLDVFQHANDLNNFLEASKGEISKN